MKSWRHIIPSWEIEKARTYSTNSLRNYIWAKEIQLCGYSLQDRQF